MVSIIGLNSSASELSELESMIEIRIDVCMKPCQLCFCFHSQEKVGNHGLVLL